MSTSRVHIIERKEEDLLSRKSPESEDIVSFLVRADMDGGVRPEGKVTRVRF